ncbi:MAG: hypothetical protein KatS3mg115_2552 [Candidatus Poribacteria bacterium]|nr:MAG: hypothetical protein KatS3mg115_2552 [Candidatus Poribacteria bacterium]
MRAAKWATGLMTLGLALSAYAGTGGDCVFLDAPAKDVPFTSEVKAEQGDHVVYLAVVGGDTPVPNACGLNPSNDPAEWAGWGGPLDYDNASIGEGPGTRNFITIGGVRYERGIGTHGPARLVYDLTGAPYARFSAVVGMDDEKDGVNFAGECGHGGSAVFRFLIDGTEVFATDVITGVANGANVDGVPVEFDIPAGASQLEIVIEDGGDGNGCDHADVADAKLYLSSGTAVDPLGKATTTWGALKER